MEPRKQQWGGSEKQKHRREAHPEVGRTPLSLLSEWMREWMELNLAVELRIFTATQLAVTFSKNSSLKWNPRFRWGGGGRGLEGGRRAQMNVWSCPLCISSLTYVLHVFLGIKLNITLKKPEVNSFPLTFHFHISIYHFFVTSLNL